MGREMGESPRGRGHMYTYVLTHGDTAENNKILWKYYPSIKNNLIWVGKTVL